MNLLTAICTIGRDAEIRHTAKGDAITSFSVALNSGYGDSQITTWINCNVWGKRGETLAPMLLKGTKIGISGELANRPYTSKDGVEKHSLELRVNDVTLLGKKDSVTDSRTGNKAEQNQASKTDPMDGLEDDIPF